IEQAVTGQIDAFRRDDGEAAFGYASPAIRLLFGTTTNFMAMVRNGYQPVYRPRSVRFGALAEEGGRIVQRVDVVGPDGRPAIALYTMQHEADGSWKIDGCEIVHAPPPTS
ncbi:MAG: DUF4864 domain-containing protein, partial [Acidisphaera sp.]|nr:DUF4864 domain-containing protein [Acidisphaera sp.]MBV9811227.1 DUF4864 domain-containing protein [Acetobacteraceae bacterium]